MDKFGNWEDINLKGGISGIKKVPCPNCSHTRKKKSDPCLYVNLDSGVAKCFNCDILFFRDKKEKSESKYKLPEQTFRNYTNLSDSVVKWFKNVRKIDQFVLKEMNITEEKYYQPAQKKEMTNIVFNYFEGETLVNKKYRSGGKDFTQTKGGKPILYNINSIIGKKECYIMEGEIDVLSLIQIGIKNCVSIPNGANWNENYWINSMQYLEGIETFYICTDNDEKGHKTAEKIANKLGYDKCERVLFEGKDANSDLQNGVLEQTIKRTAKYLHIDNLRSRDFPATKKDLYSLFDALKNEITILRNEIYDLKQNN